MSWILAMVLMGPSELAYIKNIPTISECERVRTFMEKNHPRVRSATCVEQSVTRQ
jgi:hypothetical protein